MNDTTWLLAPCLAGALFAACSSTTGNGGTQGTSSGGGGHTTTTQSTTTGSTTTSSSTSTTSSTSTSSTSTSTTSSTTTTTACSGSTPVALTVKNYSAWCSVSVNGGTASTDGSQTVCVAAGMVPLDAAPASANFILGDWHHTTGDSGSGDPGTVSGGHSTAKVAASGTSTCVWVCCPFTNGTGCPATDQCP